MTRPAISPTPVTHSQNSQETTNNDNFHSNDHPNLLLGEEQNQDTNLNDTLGALEILVKLVMRPHLSATTMNRKQSQPKIPTLMMRTTMNS